MNKKFFNKSKVLILSALTIFTSYQIGCGGSSTDIVRLKSELNSQMDVMQNILNSADYSKFIRDFVDPFYITKSGGLDSLLLGFNSTQQVQMFTTLELAKKVEPLYSSTTQKITYVGGSLTTPLTFLKIDGKWYLSGESFELKVK